MCCVPIEVSQEMKKLILEGQKDRYILKSNFISILYCHLVLTSRSGVDIPSLADSLSVGKWVPYPKFLAMFEGEEQPLGQQGSAAGDSRDDPMASLQPEKLKVQ